MSILTHGKPSIPGLCEGAELPLTKNSQKVEYEG
jgi:hypothetical protein